MQAGLQAKCMALDGGRFLHKLTLFGSRTRSHNSKSTNRIQKQSAALETTPKDITKISKTPGNC